VLVCNILLSIERSGAGEILLGAYAIQPARASILSSIDVLFYIHVYLVAEIADWVLLSPVLLDPEPAPDTFYRIQIRS
jgi:hypothetical protein